MDYNYDSHISSEQENKEDTNQDPFLNGGEHQGGDGNSASHNETSQPKKSRKVKRGSKKVKNAEGSAAQGELHRHSKKIRKTKAIRMTGRLSKSEPREEESKTHSETGLNASESGTKPATFQMNPSASGNEATSHHPNPSSMHLSGGVGTHPAKAQQGFFKTKMCAHLNHGGCTKGDKCTFAHTPEELRSTPDLKKTKLCQLYESGKCTMGEHCSFAHGETELKSTPDLYKTALCQLYMKGNCIHGAKCRFAHGEKELRPMPHKRDFGHKGYPPMNPVGGPPGYYGHPWDPYGAGPRMGMPPYDPMAMMPMDYGYMPGYYPPPQYSAPYYTPNMPPPYTGTTPYPGTYPPNTMPGGPYYQNNYSEY